MCTPRQKTLFAHPSNQAAAGRTKKDKDNHGASGSGSAHKDHKRKPEDLVTATSQSTFQRPHVSTYDKIMNDHCSHHPNSKHAAKDCFIYKQFVEQYASQLKKPTEGEPSAPNQKKDDTDQGPPGFQDSRKEFNHIFGGPQAYESKRK